MRFTHVLAMAAVVLFASGTSFADLSIVLDCDGDETNGPDTLLIEPTDTISVHVWVTGSDSAHAFGIQFGDTSGALTWIPEDAATVYKTPTGWTNTDVQVNNNMILLQSTDFSVSTPIHADYKVAELRFVVAAGESCGTFVGDVSGSGWLNLDTGDDQFAGFDKPRVCVTEVQGGGESAEGGEEGTILNGGVISSETKLGFFDDRGNSLPDPRLATDASRRPGELLLWVKPQSAVFPQGDPQKKMALNDVNLSDGLDQALSDLGVESIERVFKNFDHTELTSAPVGEESGYPRVDLRNCIRVEMPPSTPLKTSIDRLLRCPDVYWAEPNYVATYNATPNDTLGYLQWPTFPSSTYDYIGSQEGWDVTTGRSGIKVGFVDSGVDFSHPDLGTGYLNSPWMGGHNYEDFNPTPEDENLESHGTKVAGILAARLNNVLGISGLIGGWAPDSSGCELYAYRVSGPTGGPPLNLWSAAIADAGAEGMDVINCSFSDTMSSLTGKVACYSAHADGATIVCARGDLGSTQPAYPANYVWTVSVGASDEFGNLAPGSSWGDGMDVVAPGKQVLTTRRTSIDPLYPWEHASGTSIATSYVSGVAAILRSRDVNLAVTFGPEQVKLLLRRSAVDRGVPGYDDVFGAGRVDVERALQFTARPPWTWELHYPHQTYVEGSPLLTINNDYSGEYIFLPLADPNAFLSGLFHVDRYEVRLNHTSSPRPQAQWAPLLSTSPGWSASNPQLQFPYADVLPVDESERFYRWWCYEVFWPVPFPSGTWLSLGWFPYNPFTEISFIGTVGHSHVVTVGTPVGRTTEATMAIKPNPFNPVALISVSIPAGVEGAVSIYDVRGRLINILTDDLVGPIRSQIEWDGRTRSGAAAGSGAYLFELKLSHAFNDEERIVRRAFLVR